VPESWSCTQQDMGEMGSAGYNVGLEHRVSGTWHWIWRSPGLLQSAKPQPGFSDGAHCLHGQPKESSLCIPAANKQKKFSMSVTPHCRHEGNKVSRKRRMIFTLCI